jgi:hypothetical protein
MNTARKSKGFKLSTVIGNMPNWRPTNGRPRADQRGKRQETTMSATTENTLQPAPVNRDEVGQWCHPGIPAFDEGQEAEYRAWLAERGLEIGYKMLESEPEHPLYDAWFEHGELDMSSWTPTPPVGEGWFTISIHDTEDGPIWVWARHAGAAA